MRKDMAERFSEPRKRAKKNKFPRRQKKVAFKDDEGYTPVITGMRKVHLVASDYYTDKGHNADWSIMRRFLASKVGQKWDDIHSEICAQADYRSHDGHRLREHVGFMVETNCSFDSEGKLLDDRGMPLYSWWRSNCFYVHPETRTLEYVPQKRRKKKKPPHTVFDMDGNYYHQHEGLWYRVKMSPVLNLTPSVNGFYRPFVDAFGADKPPKDLEGQRMWNWWGWREALERKYGHSPEGKLWYCVEKQAVGRRTIKKVKKKHDLE